MDNLVLGVWEWLFIIAALLCISLWKAVWVQTQTTAHPYVQGFNMFSLFMWIGISFGLIGRLGWIWGAVGLAVCMIIIQAIMGLTLGQLWLYMSMKEGKYMVPTAMFAVMVWLVIALGVYVGYFRP